MEGYAKRYFTLSVSTGELSYSRNSHNPLLRGTVGHREPELPAHVRGAAGWPGFRILVGQMAGFSGRNHDFCVPKPRG